MKGAGGVSEQWKMYGILLGLRLRVGTQLRAWPMHNPTNNCMKKDAISWKRTSRIK